MPWLVAHLAPNLAVALLRDRSASLVDVLRDGIAATMADHGDACDLTNPDSPSTTVAMLRCGVDTVDYAVLGDSAVLIEVGGDDSGLIIGLDDRTAFLDDYSSLPCVGCATPTPGSGSRPISPRPPRGLLLAVCRAPSSLVRR
ncbi:hypothetical protein ACFQ9X_48310 [Catenulispora yoronensis]